MTVGGINPANVLSVVAQGGQTQGPNSPATSGTLPATGQGSFTDTLTKALDDVNQLSSDADAMANVFATGGPVSVDQLMIAQQKASLALDTVVQVRNRVVSAYQSIMNMQI